ncbi:SRPBCC family protein [Rubrivirga marina]|uniref:Polyketide cyclase n=1 Tax=Rubrivirga marina TaxID=1196024 RepID=A0A271IZP6_9BACT|nr:SRPBCC family protein [Rubrivirga marina]PAP75969.1 hypothetical protein BSZ37_05700 [Rubrivirga marina]
MASHSPPPPAVIAFAEAHVDAPPHLVWATEADLKGWPSWNPDVGWVDVAGPVVAGTPFRWLAGGIPIRSVLRAVEPGRRISWAWRAPLGLRAVHVWTFTPEDGGTRVRTVETFDGWFARIASGPLQRTLSVTLRLGVAALREESERRAGGGLVHR